MPVAHLPDSAPLVIMRNNVLFTCMYVIYMTMIMSEHEVTSYSTYLTNKADCVAAGLY